MQAARKVWIRCSPRLMVSAVLSILFFRFFCQISETLVSRAGCGKMWRLGGEREAWTGSHLGGLSFQVFCLFVKIWKQIFIPRPSQSSFVRTCLMLSGPSLSTLQLPSLLQYLLLVSYRAEDKVGHIFNEHKFYLLKDEMIVKMDHQKLKESLLSPVACPGQLCQPRRSRGRRNHSWSRIPPTHWNWSTHLWKDNLPGKHFLWKLFRWQWPILRYAILILKLQRGWGLGYTKRLDSGCDEYVHMRNILY